MTTEFHFQHSSYIIFVTSGWTQGLFDYFFPRQPPSVLEVV